MAYKYAAELIDTEYDDVMEVVTFTAADDREADEKAWVEADYAGYHVGCIRRVTASEE